MMRLLKHLEHLGHKVSKNDAIRTVLTALPEKYRDIVSRLKWKMYDLTTEEVLRDMFNDIKFVRTIFRAQEAYTYKKSVEKADQSSATDPGKKCY